MRLSLDQRRIITETVREVFGDDAEAGLFGSRADDALRGGDIDVLVRLPAADAQRQRKALTCVALLQQKLGDQPIDVVVIDPATPEDAFRAEARRTAIPL